MVSKLTFKLFIKILDTNILIYKLMYKRLIETSLKYKIVSS